MKEKKSNKLFLRSVYVALGCFIISSLLWKVKAFDVWEYKSYDQRMKATAAAFRPSDDIVMVMIDQTSLNWALEKYGWSWPWPREAYARIIDFISAGNPASIAFDMIYSEPSIYGAADDEEFARSESDSGKVIQTLFVNSKDVVFPIDVIKDNAAMIANITSIMDDDDVIRRARLYYEYEGKKYPSLGMAPLVMYGLEYDEVQPQKDGVVNLRFQDSIDRYNPYRAKYILENYELWKEGMECELLPQDFENRFVYFALYAPGLFDICSTPLAQNYPGVGVHITALDNYLNSSYIKEAPFWLTIIWIFIVAILGAGIVVLSETRKSQVKIIVFLVAGIILGSLVVFLLPLMLFYKCYWLVVFPAAFSFFTAFLTTLVLAYMIEGRQKRFIKGAFSQCLSNEVVNEIINNPSSFKLGGDVFEMTALFTDIRKFSSFSELLTAGELGELLNYYLTRMTEILIAEHATVDKYEGDAIVALVGAPVRMKDHAERACAAAIKMKQEEIVLNQEIIVLADTEKPEGISEELHSAFKKMTAVKKTIFTRIGINSGEMIAGYFGSEHKKNYTMMGSNVNLASRLEGVNKHYDTKGILISQATKNLISGRFIVRKLDRVQVVNVNTPVRLYELMGEKNSAGEEMIAYAQKWNDAMDLFEDGNYSAALESFRNLSALDPYDGTASYYVRLIERFFANGKYPSETDDAGIVYNRENPYGMPSEWIGTEKEIRGSFRLLSK